MNTLTIPIAELPEHFRPLTRTEFNQLGDLGVFGESRVELVGGVIVEMMAPGPQHVGTHVWLTRQLVRLCGDAYAVSAQNPLVLDDLSQPEPDFAVLPADYFRRSMAELPESPSLAIEIAKSSLRFDLGEKARRYAMAAVPEYWVVDVDGGVVHVHRGPNPDGTWRSVQQLTEGPLSSTAVPPVQLLVEEVLSGGGGTGAQG